MQICWVTFARCVRIFYRGLNHTHKNKFSLLSPSKQLNTTCKTLMSNYGLKNDCHGFHFLGEKVLTLNLVKKIIFSNRGRF